MNNNDHKNTAISIAREAGALLREGYRQTKEISSKSTDIDLVTQYDTRAEELIVGRLRDAFPRDAIVGEEGQYSNNPNGSGRTWFVDPLDGTVNFAHGFPVFAVSLALYSGDRPLLAVIYDPLRDECFHAAAGKGAFLSASGAAGDDQSLQVSQGTELASSLLATGFPYDKHHSAQDNLAQFGAFLKRTRGIRRAGSAALDIAYVAAGRVDGYWEYKLSSWDVAAGVLLVQEAGGRISAVDGGPFGLMPEQKNALVASNGRIHEEIVGLLESIPA